VRLGGQEGEVAQVEAREELADCLPSAADEGQDHDDAGKREEKRFACSLFLHVKKQRKVEGRRKMTVRSSFSFVSSSINRSGFRAPAIY